MDSQPLPPVSTTPAIATMPPTVPPKKSSTWKIVMISFFMIIILIYAGIFYFYSFKPTPDPLKTQAPQNPSPMQPQSTQETYSNQDFGYTLSIPQGATFTASTNVDKALPDYFGSFRLELANNPQAFQVNVFHNLGINIEAVAEYANWCTGLEVQLEKSQYPRRPGCTPTFPATQIDMHGYKAFKTVIPSSAQIVHVYYLPHKTRVYQLLITHKKTDTAAQATLDKILTSFTFTD